VRRVRGEFRAAERRARDSDVEKTSGYGKEDAYFNSRAGTLENRPV